MYDIFFNQAYLPFLEAQQRYQIFYGGAGSGKSVFLAQRAVLDCLKGRNTLVLRQVAQRVTLSCRNEILKAIDTFDLSQEFDVKKAAISHRNGAQILFGGLSDPEKIKSITPRKGMLHDIWVEEATEIRRESLKQLDKRLRGLSPFSKRISLSFNPISRTHWIYREFFEKICFDGRLFQGDDLLILKTSYKDNAFLSEDDIAALENESDPYFYAVYTKGEWGALEGRVLTQLRESSKNPPPRLPIRYGLDFGFGKSPSAAVKLAIDSERKEIYVLDEMLLHKNSNQALAEKLRAFSGKNPIVCDSAEPKSIYELRQLGIPALAAKKGKDSLRHGVRWLNGYCIYVRPQCKHFLIESENWCYQKDAFGNSLDIPETENKHLLDAMRYALEDFMLQRFACVVKL